MPKTKSKSKSKTQKNMETQTETEMPEEYDYDYDYDYEYNDNTDCLVLELRDDNFDKIFILYDWYEETYIIRGRRQRSKYFSFKCPCAEDVINFISFTFSGCHLIQLVLNNYKKIPYNSDDLDFDLLEDLNGDNFYEGDVLADRLVQVPFLFEISQMLDVVKNFYNDY